LEYHAAGIPLLAASFPTVLERVKPGIDGILLPASDSAAWADAVLALENNPELWTRLVQEGLSRAARETWIIRGQAFKSWLETEVVP
jgi:glycosyltransferase involved in cell wall biosynthesis